MGRAKAGRARLKTGPLKGGGARGGKLDIGETAKPVRPIRSREEILADRKASSNQTVGDSLYGKLAGMSDSQMTEQAQVLKAVMGEVERGNVRAAQPYAYALQKLFKEDPAQWMKLQRATGLEPREFAARFSQQVLPGGQSQQKMQRLGGELAAQYAAPNPAAEATRADFPWRWSMFLGGSEAGAMMRPDSRVAGATRSLYPELKSHEVIRVLRELSGFPFYPVAGGAQKGIAGSDPVVRAAMDLIEKNIDINPDIKRDPQLLARLRDEAGGDQAQFQRLLDNQSVSTYNPDLPGQVTNLFREALRSRPVATESAISRPIVLPGTLDPDDPNFLAYQMMDDDGNLLPVPNEVVRPMQPGQDDPSFPMGGPIRVSTASDRAAGLTARSPLAKLQEEADAILSGRGQMPDALQRVMKNPTNANADLREMIYQNSVAGGVFDLDNRTKPWRRDFVAPDSRDDGLYLGTLPPDILSTLYAQQLNKYDPQYIEAMVGPMQRSIDLFQQIQPTGKAKAYLDSIRTVDPQTGARSIPQAPLSPELMKAIQQFFQQRNKPVPQLQRRQPPMTPDMTSSNAVMPQRSQLAADRINPLAALVG